MLYLSPLEVPHQHLGHLSREGVLSAGDVLAVPGNLDGCVFGNLHEIL
jgi:hypothetical protein